MQKLSPILLVMLFAGCAQPEFRNSPDAWLGQSPPADTPQRFAPPGLNAPGYFVLGRVAFSADGKEFFYGSNNQWFSNDNQLLCYYHFDKGRWQGPAVLNHFRSQPTLSTDDQSLYVTMNDAIQTMHRSDTGWTSPVPFLKRSYILYNFMPTLGGRYYVGSNGTWGSLNDISAWKFAVLPSDLRDTSIRNLGRPLNDTAFNGDFYIAPDESYMIVSAKETKDFESELWISFHKPDDGWTAPRSLGAAINNGPAHRFGQYVTPDGKYLFYTKGTSEKDCGLYWVRFDGLLQKMIDQAGIKR